MNHCLFSCSGYTASTSVHHTRPAERQGVERSSKPSSSTTRPGPLRVRYSAKRRRAEPDEDHDARCAHNDGRD